MRTGATTDIHNTIDCTVNLTEELEDGVISTEDYLKERVRLMGRANVFHNIICTIVLVANIMVQAAKRTYI
jgi:hypothetical protein